MKLKVFTFKFSESADGFNDQPLQEFIADKEVIEFTEHFFIHDKTPYLSVILAYRDLSQEDKKILYRSQDPRKELDSREREAYDALKAWRAAKAKQEGIPPYLIANNKQIAKMVTQKATTRADLATIGGFGEAKIARYGEDILKTLTQHFNSDSVSKGEAIRETEQ